MSYSNHVRILKVVTGSGWLVTSLAVGTARGDLNASTANLAGSLASGLAVMMAIIGQLFLL